MSTQEKILKARAQIESMKLMIELLENQLDDVNIEDLTEVQWIEADVNLAHISLRKIIGYDPVKPTNFE